MASPTSISRHSAWLALLCACVVALAWAMPSLADVQPGLLKDWPTNSGQPLADLTDSQSQTFDDTDEPAILVSIASTILQPLIFSLQSVHPAAWAWSPQPPVRPPIILNSI